MDTQQNTNKPQETEEVTEPQSEQPEEGTFPATGAEKKGNNTAIIGGALALAALLIGGAILYTTGVFDSEPAEDVVATVNGENIYEDELEARVAQFAMQAPGQQEEEPTDEERRQALDQIIDEKLLMKEVRDLGYEVDQEMIDQEYSTIRDQFETEEEFNQALEENDITVESLREDIEKQMVVDQYVEDLKEEHDINPSEEDVQALYEQLVSGQEDPAPLEEVRGEVEEMAVNEQLGEVLQGIIADLRSGSDIEIFI